VNVRVTKVLKVRGEEDREEEDLVAVEEPLEVRVCSKECEPFAVVMRTPGEDEELAVGFLYSEGVIERAEDVIGVKKGGGHVDVYLRKEVHAKARQLLVSSSCGVCGRSLLYAVDVVKSNAKVRREVLFSLPEKLRRGQDAFNATGGIHASALFTLSGELVYLREDVGRHNAVDKVVGRLLLDGRLPGTSFVLQVSGRVGYEIMVKAVKAGIPVVSGISAPTSYAVELARETGVCLVGFLRGRGFNVYSHPERVV
jgi:FdhD protein